LKIQTGNVKSEFLFLNCGIALVGFVNPKWEYEI